MNIDWASVFNWMSLLKCFVVGGLICVIGQILIDKTKLTPARILVIFVTTGAILGVTIGTVLGSAILRSQPKLLTLQIIIKNIHTQP